MNQLTQDEKNFFRENVNSLKRIHPEWTQGKIANFIIAGECPEPLRRMRKRSLYRAVKRQMQRVTVEDRPRQGAPITVSTTEFQQELRTEIRHRLKKSTRNTAAVLRKRGRKCSHPTVWRNAKKLKLKWYKRKKSMKLNDNQKQQRVVCAQRLLKKYGIKKNTKKFAWNRIVNTDFSGKFTLMPFQNKHNDGYWGDEENDNAPPEIVNAPTDKYQKGIMFWGAISFKGLIPKSGPINFTNWLKKQQPKKKGKNGKKGKQWLTGQLYAKFVRQKIAPAVYRVFGDDKPIFQDDQDNKQRTQVAMEAVEEKFEERVEIQDGDAKFADCWRIEEIWGALKEMVRGIEFANEAELEKEVIKKWKTFDVTKCKQMMEDLPRRFQMVIAQNGEQLH